MPIQIDLDTRGLVVSDPDRALNSVHRSQLRFWGFAGVGTGSLWVSPAGETRSLTALAHYLAKYSIEVEFSDSALRQLEELSNHKRALSDLRQSGLNFKEGAVDPAVWRLFAARVASLIPRTLKNHQLKSLYHTSLLQREANFSVPGSGKTAVVLSYFELLRSESKVDSLFVIGPPSSFGAWTLEFERTLGRRAYAVTLAGLPKTERLARYAANNSTTEVYLISYSTLYNDLQDVRSFLERFQGRVLMTVDEAHYIKRVGGEWANAVLALAGLSSYKVVLSGTPMPNAYSDLFNLFDFLWQDDSPLDEERKAIVLQSESRGTIQDLQTHLRDWVGPFFYRVRKSDLGLLPQILHDPIYVRQAPIEAGIYAMIHARITELAESDFKQNAETLALLKRGRIMRLRQAASNCSMLRRPIEQYEEDLLATEELANRIANYSEHEVPSKAQALLELIREFVELGHPVLVWTNFVDTVLYLRELIVASGYTCKVIYGATPYEANNPTGAESREAIREQFNSGVINVLVANPAACAESISLHEGCSHAIYYDLSYNCAQYLQSLDRIHRVGRSEVVEAHYYFLQYPQTIDEDILDRVRMKAARMEQLIDLEYSIYSLDMSDIDDDVDAYDHMFGGPKN